MTNRTAGLSSKITKAQATLLVRKLTHYYELWNLVWEDNNVIDFYIEVMTEMPTFHEMVWIRMLRQQPSEIESKFLLSSLSKRNPPTLLEIYNYRDYLYPEKKKKRKRSKKKKKKKEPCPHTTDNRIATKIAAIAPREIKFIWRPENQIQQGPPKQIYMDIIFSKMVCCFDFETSPFPSRNSIQTAMVDRAAESKQREAIGMLLTSRNPRSSPNEKSIGQKFETINPTTPDSIPAPHPSSTAKNDARECQQQNDKIVYPNSVTSRPTPILPIKPDLLMLHKTSLTALNLSNESTRQKFTTDPTTIQSPPPPPQLHDIQYTSSYDTPTFHKT